jgi:hypothetical protein
MDMEIDMDVDMDMKMDELKCYNSKMLQRGRVVVVKCHSRLFVGRTFCAGQNFVWSFCGWT